MVGPLSLLSTDQFPVVTAARTANKGLAIGLAYGLAQDGLGVLRGRRLRYVDFLTGKQRQQRREDKLM
jgi:hypothetical protein